MEGDAEWQCSRLNLVKNLILVAKSATRMGTISVLTRAYRDFKYSTKSLLSESLRCKLLKLS